MSKDIYNLYDNFAFFYNKYWTKTTPYLMEKVLEKLLFPKVKIGGNILDLCCGTGQNSFIIQNKGYNVTGIDGSQSMLAYALINAPDCRFIHDDIRYFKLEKKFDAVVSLFDSINHIMDSDDIVKSMVSVYNHLKSNGVFIFDINSLKAAKDSYKTNINIIEDDHVLILTADYFTKNKVTKYNITMFLKDQGSWIRSDQEIFERYYSVKDILKYLKKAGFSNYSVADGYEELGVDAFKDRIFITAWK